MASTTDSPLGGKAIVITGSGRGVGRGVALEAARLGAACAAEVRPVAGGSKMWRQSEGAAR